MNSSALRLSKACTLLFGALGRRRAERDDDLPQAVPASES